MASMDNELDDAVNGDGGKRAKKQALAKMMERRRLLKEKRNMSTTRPIGKTKAQIEAEACRSVSADPRADRSLKSRQRPKSATLTRRLEKKMLNRLQRTTGSCFFGPGMGVRKNIKNIRSSGSAKYLQQKIRKKLAEVERANSHDNDSGKQKKKRKETRRTKGRKRRPSSAALIRAK